MTLSTKPPPAPCTILRLLKSTVVCHPYPRDLYFYINAL